MMEDQKEMLKRDMNDPDKPLRNLVCVCVCVLTRALPYVVCKREYVSELVGCCVCWTERDCACVLTLTHRTMLQRK